MRTIDPLQDLIVSLSNHEVGHADLAMTSFDILSPSKGQNQVYWVNSEPFLPPTRFLEHSKLGE